MVVYYFGADKAWESETASDLNRRNMAVMLTLAELPEVDYVYNVIRCTRSQVLNKSKQKLSNHPKIKNQYIAPIMPEKGYLKLITRPFNQWYLKRRNHISSVVNSNSISWCYWPKGYLDYKFYGLKNKMVFDSDHNIIDDPNINAAHKNKQKDVLLQSAKDAELILSSSRSMLEWYKQMGFNNSSLMFNGVFETRKNLINNKLNKDFTVTYCGTLSKWVKSDWLIKMANEHPKWQINIIGKNYKTKLSSRLESLNNIMMHGFLKPFEVDVILKQSNVCIGLYQEHTALDVNSMKLYDYLLQGKPVVVNNYHKNLSEDFKGLITVVSNYQDFIKFIMNSNTPEYDKVSQFLEEVVWQNRVYKVLKKINEV